MQNVKWLPDLFTSIDRKDAAAFESFLCNDVTFRFGNEKAVTGSETATAAVRQFFSSVKALRHDLTEVWKQGDDVICHGTVTYTRHDDSRLSVPFANVFTTRDGKISHYFIFVDISALYT